MQPNNETTILLTMWLVLATVLSAFVTSTYGGCEFPSEWSGLWFQSGVPSMLKINSTYIETKGECHEHDRDKYLIYERNGGEDCYRCVVINQKHPSVLQYKETFCVSKASLQDICYGITGDAPLYSMFKSQPQEPPEPCPFKGAPFSFTYNKGSGDCVNPPSRAESCTDDSRLVLKYQACPDVIATESNVEQLICLAVWKEGSTRYMVGRVLQTDRRSAAVASDEDQYRCFVYERVPHQSGKGVTYNIAQSGDATCNGLQNAVEGSRTIKLTTVDDHHNRCRFPVWLTEHHTWHSLDHRLSYRFSQRNATLRVKSSDGGSPSSDAGATQQGNDQYYGGGEPYYTAQRSHGSHQHLYGEEGTVRLVCHSILHKEERKKVQIVAHVTAGCKSGHVCMVFYKRDNNVIEVQQSGAYEENADDACRNFDPKSTPYTTLITASLHTKKCPHSGRYTVVGSSNGEDDGGRRRRRSQNTAIDGGGSPSGSQECTTHNYESLAIGCSTQHEEMEIRSTCRQNLAQSTTSAYSCHDSWEENGTTYLIASPVARKSTDPYRYCFVFAFSGAAGGDPSQSKPIAGPSGTSPNGLLGGSNGKTAGIVRGMSLKLLAIADNCHRNLATDVVGHSWTLNLTSNGTCADSEGNNATIKLVSTFIFSICLLVAIAIVR